MINMVSRMSNIGGNILKLFIFEVICTVLLVITFTVEPNLDILAVIIILIMTLAIPISIIVFLFQIYYGKYKNKQLEKELNVPEYYREVMHEHSPLEMAYLYHKRIEKTDVMAHLNYMHRKKMISLENGGIEILEMPTYEEDIYILNHINTLDSSKSLKDLKKMMRRRAEEDGFLQSLSSIRTIALFIALFIIYRLFKELIFIICFLLFPIWGLIPMIGVFWNKKDNMNYTKLGYETLLKLRGLKKFLEDFGSMENKTSDDIVLYEDYIVYGIILECSSSLVNDAKKDLEKVIQSEKERNQ